MKLILGSRYDTHMTSMEIIQFSRPPTPLFNYVQKSSNLLTLGVQFQMKSPSPNGNQSIQIKYNPRITLICYQVLPSAFLFSINSLISSSFNLTFLNLAEGSLSAFSWLCTLYTHVCLYSYTLALYTLKFSKNITKCILLIIIFSTHFEINLL